MLHLDKDVHVQFQFLDIETIDASDGKKTPHTNVYRITQLILICAEFLIRGGCNDSCPH